MLHQIGAGVLGPVFRAYDPERDRLVAVKLFRLDLPPEKVHQLVAAFEQLVAAELTHPAMAAPLVTGIAGANAYLAQEYVAAESLDIAVREYGPAPPADALRVAAQVAGALDFAAVVDIAHGALHPRDVLLSSDETRMTGVGVASALARVGAAVPVRRPYAAPEQIAGGAWDRRADIFSLAAVIHELMWGRRVTGTGPQVAEAITPIEGADIDRVRAAFARAMADDPAARFETALDFVEALKEGFPAVAIPTPKAVVSSRSTRSKRRVASEGRVPEGRVPEERAPELNVEPRLPLDVEPHAEEPVVAAPIVAEAVIADVADAPTLEAPDLELRPAAPVEEPRFVDVESAPVALPPIEVPAGPRPEGGPDVPANSHAEPVHLQPEVLASLDRAARSAVWPLVLALLVGVALGFAAGYGLGTHERTTPSAGVAVVNPAVVPEPSDPVLAPPAAAAPAPAVMPAPVKAAPLPARPAPRPVETPKEVHSRRQDDKAAEQNPGRLLVRSTPSGAQVLVDGVDAGRTPATVRNLAHGPHIVRVVHEGYVAAERRIVLTRSRPAQAMVFPLAAAVARGARAKPAAEAPVRSPVRLSGSLNVESRPSGAKAYVDNKLVGTTPLVLSDVAAGSHAVRFEFDGYRHWTSSVRITSGETTRITASLEK